MRSSTRNARRRNARRVAATAVASGLLATGALALTTSAASAATISHHGTSYSFQTIDNPKDLTFNQLLGVNDCNVAIGFYTDANGTNHGYEYNIRTNQFSTVVDPNAPSASLTAAAINDEGHVAGVYTNPANGVTDGFLLTRHGQFTDLAVPGAASTMALGVNNRDEVAGVYADAAGNMHGFTWTARHGFSTVDDPNGMTTTTINGVNDFGQVVGFYVDSAGNTDGFLATPQH